ncbi:MAG: type I-C CRISPR-associated protein Cas8c/Csd1 [Planctomycetaceae bacterium]|nr:type I-C CRISPR-associated protein Cas8c/Csd1 [Planctomycetaceae bacterium]
MIIQALNAYYERLAADPDSDVAPFGFSRQKISFCVVLNADGSLHEIVDERRQIGKKAVPVSLVVPGNAKPSGSGINPCFLWDNPAYLLGYKVDDSKPERTRQSFEALRDRHLAAEEAIGDEEFSAVCRFLQTWNPADAPQQPTLVDVGTGFGVFRLRGARQYVHDRPAVERWWRTQIAAVDPADAETLGQCLATGETEPIARLHQPKIKGVWGSQSSGAALVSFNLDAFESYGKRQSVNAPVSERAAFQYCTALNRLLASQQRVQVGDASVVFWTEEPSPAESLLARLFDPPRDAEDATLRNQIESQLRAIAAGGFPPAFGEKPTPFFVLGLSPNAARVSVRFWHESTLGNLVDNLHRHFSDLKIARGPKDFEFPTAWHVLRETARETKEIPPLLAGGLMRAVLTGSPYPDLLLTSVIRRMRTERNVWHVRAAVIKACLNRNYKKELPMALDPERPEPTYHLGRLFAELEKTQEDALPGLNDTIKDRYFGAASATPGSVFPRLVRLSQHHLGKLEKALRLHHEKRIQEIVGRLDGFPSHLALTDQGLFAVGYYHQRQDMFTKKTVVEPAATAEASPAQE